MDNSTMTQPHSVVHARSYIDEVEKSPVPAAAKPKAEPMKGVVSFIFDYIFFSSSARSSLSVILRWRFVLPGSCVNATTTRISAYCAMNLKYGMTKFSLQSPPVFAANQMNFTFDCGRPVGVGLNSAVLLLSVHGWMMTLAVSIVYACAPD